MGGLPREPAAHHTGNLAGEARAALFVIDDARRRRLKLFGTLGVLDAEHAPALVTSLSDPAYDAVVERVVLVDVHTFDWNCPQHITRRFTLDELAEAAGGA